MLNQILLWKAYKLDAEGFPVGDHITLWGKFDRVSNYCHAEGYDEPVLLGNYYALGAVDLSGPRGESIGDAMFRQMTQPWDLPVIKP